MVETYSNSYLNNEQQKGNAQIILDTLLDYNWTKNAICGMLGNMQVESTLNPGIYQNLNPNNPDLGFGLVQWTPKAKYITNYAIPKGYTTYDQYGRIKPQLERILDEVAGLYGQWQQKAPYLFSFYEYTQSTESPEYLASAFLINYERAGVEVEELRRRNARKWFDELEGNGGAGSDSKYLYKQGDNIFSLDRKTKYKLTATNMWIKY